MSYDDWKLATPPEYDEERDERCPHGEDTPDDCEACNFEPDLEEPDDQDDECPHCDFGCSGCNPLVEKAGAK